MKGVDASETPPMDPRAAVECGRCRSAGFRSPDSSMARATEPVLVEVCCETLESVYSATRAGAPRIELCAALLEGGLTPSRGLLKATVRATAGSTRVHVLVRPRPGDFVYSDEEVEAMVEDVVDAKELGARCVGSEEERRVVDSAVERRREDEESEGGAGMKKRERVG